MVSVIYQGRSLFVRLQHLKALTLLYKTQSSSMRIMCVTSVGNIMRRIPGLPKTTLLRPWNPPLFSHPVCLPFMVMYIGHSPCNFIQLLSQPRYGIPLSGSFGFFPRSLPCGLPLPHIIDNLIAWISFSRQTRASYISSCVGHQTVGPTGSIFFLQLIIRPWNLL